MKGSDAAYLTSLAEDLSRQLGTKVTIRTSGRQGRIEIEFYTNDDLDRLIDAPAPEQALSVFPAPWACTSSSTATT